MNVNSKLAFLVSGTHKVKLIPVLGLRKSKHAQTLALPQLIDMIN